jgi:hypothetical protein
MNASASSKLVFWIGEVEVLKEFRERGSTTETWTDGGLVARLGSDTRKH